MANRTALSDERYFEILDRVVFGGHYFLSESPEDQNRTIEIYGGRVDARGLSLVDNDGAPVQSRAEPWEADQFRIRAGDLQQELGPSGWTDHLTTLDLHTTEWELKRFYARTRYYPHPQIPKQFKVAMRTPDGQLLQFTLERSTTEAFSTSRDLDQIDALKACGWPQTYPADFFVCSRVVTCLRPLDPDLPPTFTIGLGRLRDTNGRTTDFILVWFLDKARLGLVFDYTLRGMIDEDVGIDDPNSIGHASKLKSSFDDFDCYFSLATLDGDFRFGDGTDPEKELTTQLAGDITLYLNPFAYQGFRVEDACRYEGVIQEFRKDLLLQVMDRNDI